MVATLTERESVGATTIEDRWFCGLHVSSELPLPDLLPWTGATDVPDVRIRLGDVPRALPRTVFDGPLLQIADDGACRFAIPGVASYVVRDGCRIDVETEIDPAAPDIRVFLLGTVFGLLCHQRGLLPLHASCVETPNGAVAICGRSGEGKSTLAAALQQRGHALLADDLTVVNVAAPGRPVVLPAFPRLKLWRDAMDAFALSAEGLERSRPGMEKFHVPVADSFACRPLPLAGVYILHDAIGPMPERVEETCTVEAVSLLAEHVYRGSSARWIRGKQPLLQAVGHICGSAPVGKLWRRRALSDVGATAALIGARHM